MNNLPVLITKHLVLDMPRVLEKLFPTHIRIAKTLLPLAAPGPIRPQQIFHAADDAHPTPAAAGRSLQNQRVANFFRRSRKPFLTLNNSVAAWHRHQTCRANFPPCTVLITHHFDDFWRGTNKGNFRSLANLREISIFRQKPVTRMNGIHVGNFCRADYLGDVQVTLAAARRPNAHRFIREAHVQRIAVRFAVHRHRGNTQFLTGADYPQGDFPSISYKDFLEHSSGMRLFLPARPDAKQGLAILHRLPVFDIYAYDLAAGV